MGKDSKQEVITMDTVQQMTSPPATLEGQETDSIHIDTAAIPDHIRGRIHSENAGMLQCISGCAGKCRMARCEDRRKESGPHCRMKGAELMAEELRELRIEKQIPAKEMVAVVQTLYPKYDKTVQSKCENGDT